MDLKKILLLAICLSCISNAAQAIGEIPAGVMDAAGSAGNLNVHDMDRIRDLERRKEQEEDWKELKKRQKEEQKKEQQVDKIEKKQKKMLLKQEQKNMRLKAYILIK